MAGCRLALRMFYMRSEDKRIRSIFASRSAATFEVEELEKAGFHMDLGAYGLGSGTYFHTRTCLINVSGKQWHYY